MPKKFKIIQNLERKYNGENLPIRVRQDDIGTIIESKIVTEENTPYDLTNRSVAFNLKPSSGTPILNEKATILDPTNGTISYSLSSKDTKNAGKAQSAFFTISDINDTVIESTGDIDLTILPFPHLTDDDYIKVTTTLERLNNNDPDLFLFDAPFVHYDDKPAFRKGFGQTLPDERYDDLRKQLNAGKKWYYQDAWGVGDLLIYAYKIDKAAKKIRINNLYLGTAKKEDTGLSADLNPALPQFYIDNRTQNITAVNNDQSVYFILNSDNLKQLDLDLQLNGFTPLEKSTANGKIYYSAFEIDLSRVNCLTKDGYLLFWVPHTVLDGKSYYFASPQLEYTQFYLEQ